MRIYAYFVRMSARFRTIRTLDAKALRRAMVARNWCNTELANEAGVDPDTVARALTDDLPLAQKTEARILAALSRKAADHAIAAVMKELIS